MVADCAGVVSYKVEHTSCNMGRNGIDIIIIIYCRLPLKYIAVVDNDDSIVAHPAAHVSDGRGHTRQTAVGWLSGNKIVGIEIAVHVACLKHSQLYIFGKKSGSAKRSHGKYRDSSHN